MSRLTTRVASAGTSSVATKTRNTTRLPGNSSIANAYAASTDVITCATVTTNATTNELRRYRPRRPSFHASINTSKVIVVGTSGFFSTSLPGFNAATTVV